MKKYLTVLFSMMLFSPAVFAELSSFDVKETIKEYSDLTREVMRTQIGTLGVNYSDIEYFPGDYTTKQYISKSELGEGTMPVPEERTSEGYYELKINLSTKEGPVRYESFGFSNHGSILMNINGKDIRFELDCTVVSAGKTIDLEYDENGDATVKKNAEITLRYPKKYFTLLTPSLYYRPKVINSKFRYAKDGEKKKQIKLEAKIYETLVIESLGFELYFVLEPNLKNIYTDFEFVRKLVHEK